MLESERLGSLGVNTGQKFFNEFEMMIDVVGGVFGFKYTGVTDSKMAGTGSVNACVL